MNPKDRSKEGLIKKDTDRRILPKTSNSKPQTEVMFYETTGHQIYSEGGDSLSDYFSNVYKLINTRNAQATTSNNCRIKH